MTWRTFASASRRPRMKCSFETIGSLCRRRLQPEAELLRPLITHVETERWIPTAPKRKVLYTHTVENGKRVPIRLKDYPRARAYLESHKERLSRRRYVIEAGRQWYEIWVPHNPMRLVKAQDRLARHLRGAAILFRSERRYCQRGLLLDDPPPEGSSPTGCCCCWRSPIPRS